MFIRAGSLGKKVGLENKKLQVQNQSGYTLCLKGKKNKDYYKEQILVANYWQITFSNLHKIKTVNSLIVDVFHHFLHVNIKACILPP